MTEKLKEYIRDNENLIAEIDDWIARSKPQYIEYEKCKNQCYEVQCKYNRLLAEKEELFSRTQPQAIKYDKEVVSGGKPGNTFDEYLAAKEKKRIDERLAELKSMVDDYNHLLEIKRNQLEKSENIKDKIYYYRIVKRWSIELVCKKVGYREAQLHRYLKDINEELKQR